MRRALGIAILVGLLIGCFAFYVSLMGSFGALVLLGILAFWAVAFLGLWLATPTHRSEGE